MRIARARLSIHVKVLRYTMGVENSIKESGTLAPTILSISGVLCGAKWLVLTFLLVIIVKSKNPWGDTFFRERY